MKPTKETIETDLKLFSLKEMAEKYGVSISQAYRYIKSYGFNVYKPRKCKLKDEVFGRLTVKEEDRSRSGHSYWLCECECGNRRSVRADVLLDGLSKSCGCKRNEELWKGCGEISGSKWIQIIKGAESRNIPFEIDIEFGWKLFLQQDRKCALTKLPLNFCRNIKAATRIEPTASLDRIDSSKGYTEDNVQWVHKIVNVMKQDIPENIFISICQLIVNNRQPTTINIDETQLENLRKRRKR
jgi:predicted DNA-binding transcriptional regulator AlpA